MTDLTSRTLFDSEHPQMDPYMVDAGYSDETVKEDSVGELLDAGLNLFVDTMVMILPDR